MSRFMEYAAPTSAGTSAQASSTSTPPPADHHERAGNHGEQQHPEPDLGGA
jgi:hypothetical protein